MFCRQCKKRYSKRDTLAGPELVSSAGVKAESITLNAPARYDANMLVCQCGRPLLTIVYMVGVDGEKPYLME